MLNLFVKVFSFLFLFFKRGRGFYVKISFDGEIKSRENSETFSGVCLARKLSPFSDISQNSTLEKQTLHKTQYEKNTLHKI